ncbi:MAG: ATP-binding cassette domain-containing protein [Streptosporangiaceae bacterium]|jgi:ABC-2 type transport system ATP-binding protein
MSTLIRTKAPHGATAPARLNETASKQAVEIEHLRKTYGTLVAVDDVSFSVAAGEIFGILGPNGAGKTTTVECAIGLRTPDSGTIRLMGLDPAGRPGPGPPDRRGATRTSPTSPRLAPR